MAYEAMNFANIQPQGNPFLRNLVPGIQNAMMFPQKLQDAKLANAIKQVQAQYAQPMAQEDLQKAKLFNKFYEPDMRSQIGLRGAQAGKLGKETEWYDREAQAHTDLEKAQSGLYGSQAQQNSVKLKYLQKLLGEDNNDSSNQQSSPPTEQKNESIYGIETPKPNKEDLQNKFLLGIDTFSSKQQAAKQQQMEQQKDFLAKSMQFSKEAQDAAEFNRQLDQYNYWMDKTPLKGVVGGLVPGSSTASKAVDTITNQMALGAIERTRDAMGSARFAVADLKVALSLKPNRGWTNDQRKFFTDFTKAVNGRLNERSQFYNVIRSHPELGISNADADALWTSYQNHFPIANEKGNEVINQHSNWKQFITPEAIESVKKSGDYTGTPESAITEENIRDTMKATGLTYDQVVKELNKRGHA